MRRMALLAVAVLAVAVGSAKANLIVNGDFEAGNLSGWTLTGNGAYINVYVGAGTGGSFGGSFGPAGALSYIGQVVNVTPGSQYTLSFDLLNNGGTPNNFQVSVDGNVLMSLTNAPQFDYTHYSFDVVPVGSTTDIEFGFRNDLSYYYFDNASLVNVPEPASLAVIGLAAGMLMVRSRRAK